MKKLGLKSIIAFALMLFTTFALVGCGGDNTEIAILLPDATHGWPVGVIHYAGVSAKELEKEGYKVKVITAKSASEQVSQIEDVLTLKSLKGIVILPFDNDAASGVEQIVDKKIPFVQFDRLIEGVQADANVQGDNHGIGYETARVMVEKGLKPGDKILELPGDNSTVPAMRSAGFREYLTKEANWTAAQIATIDKLDFTGWSRENSDRIFNDWLDSKDQAALLEYEYIFTHDDEIALGVMDVIQRVEKDLTHIKVLASSAGKQEYYKILNEKPAGGYLNGKLGDAYLFSVTYPPYMIQDCIDLLMDVLGGKTVSKDVVIPVKIVDDKNASEFLNPASPY